MNLTSPKITSAKTSMSAAAKGGGGQAVLLIIITVLLGYYVVLPKYNEYGETKKKLDDAKAELVKVQSAQSQINRLIGELNDDANKDTLAVLDEAVPLQSRSSRIYILMESLIQSSGLGVGSISIDPLTSLVSQGTQKKAGPYDESRDLTTYTISLSMTGNMQNFLKFLTVLENNPRLFDITALEIGGDQADALSFRLTIKTYAYAPHASTAETTTTGPGGVSPTAGGSAAPTSINVPPATTKP